MDDKERLSKKILDEMINSVREEKLDQKQVAEISERVSEQMGLGQKRAIRGCEDVQSLIGDYLAGGLTEARRLLVEDHTRECFRCRKFLTEARTSRLAEAKPRPSYRTNLWLKWGSIAAGVLLTFAVVQLAMWNGLIPGFNGFVAAVESSRGDVFDVSGQALIPMQNNDRLKEREVIRTGRGSGAVLRLEDGSLVELAERTELSLRKGWRGTSVQLKRGNVIVQAAQQGSGHLYVTTGQCRVAVKGTVFSVSHGMKGSRVSVIEGEVLVEKAGEDTLLQAGQQYASHPSLRHVPIAEEFKWSENAPEHLAMLEELSLLQEELKQASYGDELRYSSDLVGLLPAGTFAYGAFPNVSGKMEAVYQLFRERLLQSPAVSEWLRNNPDETAEFQQLDELVQRLRGFGELLGDEIVIGAVAAEDFNHVRPLVLASVKDAEQFLVLANQEAERLHGESGAPVLYILDSLPSPPSVEKALFVLVDQDLVVASPSFDLIEEIFRNVATSAQSSFADSRLFETVSDRYSDGVDWLFAVDLQQVMAAASRREEAEHPGRPRALEKLGIARVQELVIERKQNLGVPDNRAVLTYQEVGEGLMSWLAQPGPMGALDFVSRDANLAAAFVVENPAKMVDDIFELIESTDPEAWQELTKFEEEHGVSIRRDIAEPLGGEVVFALDGPMLPTPSWKVILEVYRPDVLQRTIEWALDEVNQLAAEENQPGILLHVSDLDGRAQYELVIEKTGTSFFYQYVNGYLILAPDPTLITHAAQYQSSGYTLPTSPDFARLLPQDSSVNMSGLFYHNLAPLLDPLISSQIGRSVAGSVEVQERMSSLVGRTPPMMVSLLSESGRVTVSSNGDLDSFWSNVATLSTLGGPDGVARLLRQGLQQ